MNNSIRTIETERAAPAGGHYVQATLFQNQLYISGQLPVHSDGRHTFEEPFGIQARQAISNLLEILKAAGGEASNLLKVNVYIVGVSHWQEFNSIYSEMLGDVKPARAIIPVPELHHGYLIEVDAVAAVF